MTIHARVCLQRLGLESITCHSYYCCYYYYHHCPADRICTNCNNNWVHYRRNKTLKTRYGSTAKAPSTPYRPVKCQQHQAPAPFFVFLDANVCYTFLDLTLQCTFTCYNMCASNACFQKTEHWKNQCAVPKAHQSFRPNSFARRESNTFATGGTHFKHCVQCGQPGSLGGCCHVQGG